MAALRRCAFAAAFAVSASASGGFLPRNTSGLLTDAETCPGAINIRGYGLVDIVATKWNVGGDPAAAVEVNNGTIYPHQKGRAYFASACTPGKYDNEEYLALKLLGKTLKYTTDMSTAGCGCNVALYLTNLHQNSKESQCKDYYCDANSVCGVKCHEIDIQEGNAYSWMTSLHSEDDRYGKGGGYGGGGSGWHGPRDWDKAHYGPNGTCINTSSPFQVAASFPVNQKGILQSMTIELSQVGRPCNLSINVAGYDGNSTTNAKGSGNGMLAMTQGLTAGMTPIVSYWSAKDMTWLDGEGDDHLGPCHEGEELAVPCSQKVPFYDFSIEDIPEYMNV